MRRIERVALLLALVLVAPTLAAQAVLDGYARIVPQLPLAERAQLRQRAATWTGWSAAERAAFAARVAAWDASPLAQRADRRERYAAWRALPLAEKVRMRVALMHYAGLPLDQQLALRARFDALDRSDRRGWLLGPSLGADYPALQPLLAQVPAGEREALLRVLRAMPPQQRIDLGVLAQRTAPQARAELRRALLSTSTGNRQQWLWQQLER